MNFGFRGLHFPIILYFLVLPCEGFDSHWFRMECYGLPLFEVGVPRDTGAAGVLQVCYCH